MRSSLTPTLGTDNTRHHTAELSHLRPYRQVGSELRNHSVLHKQDSTPHFAQSTYLSEALKSQNNADEFRVMCLETPATETAELECLNLNLELFISWFKIYCQQR